MTTAPTHPVAVRQCSADHPMPAGTSPRDLARWEHPELKAVRGDATRSTYHCVNCGVTISVPRA